MNQKMFFTVSILTIGLVFIQIPSYPCQVDRLYETCSQPFECAANKDISYPFWGGGRPESCGYPGFQLTCQEDQPLLNISSMFYRVLQIDNRTHTLKVARQDLFTTYCPATIQNTTLDFNLFGFSSTSNDGNITLYYGCTINPPPPPGSPLANLSQFSCDVGGTNRVGLYMTQEAALRFGGTGGFICDSNITVPVNRSMYEALAFPAPVSTLTTALESGFSIEWSANNSNCGRCVESGGVCGYNQDSASFACYCTDRPYDFTCNDTQTGNGSSSNTRGLSIGLPIAGAVLAGVGLGWFIFYCKQRSKKQVAAKSFENGNKEIATPPSSKGLSTPLSTNFTKSIPSYPSSKSDLGRGSTYFGVHVFDYSELEEATNNFDPSRELGDGGFGTVYYGVLADGRVVAVKRLYENNIKRVEQFMNEVEILTRLRHKNLVMLYGCTSKRSRELLLVYEYIPNGTVADHLHGRRANSGLLSWPVRLNIAIETADALAYLHKSDIIHRDVKTNNVLLDTNFHVKVADFGLSRLFPTDVTHVSTAPQGTPGYVDPEYYQCYQLTEKSDVYSFGVMLIELVSSLQAVDTSRHRHDINLANMAINKIQNRTLHELVDSSLGFETNSTVRRMVTLVAELAFRCLQQERDMRPSMEDVLEALKGIQNEDLNAHKVEIVDILVDEDARLPKGSMDTLSSDSVVPDKWGSSSTPNSSG